MQLVNSINNQNSHTRSPAVEEGSCIVHTTPPNTVWSYPHVSAKCTYVQMYIASDTRNMTTALHCLYVLDCMYVPSLAESHVTFTLVAVMMNVKSLGGFGGPVPRDKEGLQPVYWTHLQLHPPILHTVHAWWFTWRVLRKCKIGCVECNIYTAEAGVSEGLTEWQLGSWVQHRHVNLPSLRGVAGTDQVQVLIPDFKGLIIFQYY